MRTQPPVPTASLRVSKRFCDRLRDGTAPRPKRSSGTKCRPICLRGTGPKAATAWPDKPTLAAPHCTPARVSSPDKAHINSLWPLPDTPARPTTSPARTCRLMPSRSTPNGSCRVRLRPCTDKTTSPGARATCCKAGGSAPIIKRLSEAFVSSRGSHTPVSFPPRNTVQALHSARISCSLCEMYKMLTPWLTNLCSTTKSFSTACGVSTEVGSSKIKSLGSVSKARMISTLCISPTLRVCTGRSGSKSRPYSLALATMRSVTSARLSDLSRPSHTFSATVSVSNKLKCWNTMLMPSLRASCGLRICTG